MPRHTRSHLAQRFEQVLEGERVQAQPVRRVAVPEPFALGGVHVQPDVQHDDVSLPHGAQMMPQPLQAIGGAIHYHRRVVVDAHFVTQRALEALRELPRHRVANHVKARALVQKRAQPNLELAARHRQWCVKGSRRAIGAVGGAPRPLVAPGEHVGAVADRGALRHELVPRPLRFVGGLHVGAVVVAVALPLRVEAGQMLGGMTRRQPIDGRVRAHPAASAGGRRSFSVDRSGCADIVPPHGELQRDGTPWVSAASELE